MLIVTEIVLVCQTRCPFTVTSFPQFYEISEPASTISWNYTKSTVARSRFCWRRHKKKLKINEKLVDAIHATSCQSWRTEHVLYSVSLSLLYACGNRFLLLDCLPWTRKTACSTFCSRIAERNRAYAHERLNETKHHASSIVYEWEFVT